MIFLCAQPDTPNYFFWQLEVQLNNFKRLGVDLSKVHQVFVSQVEMSEEFKQYRAKYPEINIHWYPDTRRSKTYIPSMRPNGIKQFFAEFPEMENERVFFHDADIVFNTLPDFSKMNEDSTWYLSDTNSYVNADYINQKGSTILDEMTDIVGISKEAVEAVNRNSGGAQYYVDGLSFEFFDKLENDCEALYKYMNESVPKWRKEFAVKTGKSESEYHQIQSWCSDLFCFIWGGLLLEKKMQITHLLDFSWATDNIQSYFEKPIYHNAGAVSNEGGKLFYKGEFIHKSPFGVDFSSIDPNRACSMYVKEIMDTAKSFNQ